MMLKKTGEKKNGTGKEAEGTGEETRNAGSRRITSNYMERGQ